jgi:hypothetical protein
MSDLRAHAILLQQQLDAISGADIAHIRHSEGGVELAKKVVKLKNAADWLIQAATEHLAKAEVTNDPPGT